MVYGETLRAAAPGVHGQHPGTLGRAFKGDIAASIRRLRNPRAICGHLADCCLDVRPQGLEDHCQIYQRQNQCTHGKKSFQLDNGCPKSTGPKQPELSQPTGSKALPISKPKPASKVLGPRQQVKSAAALIKKENSSVAANRAPADQSNAGHSSKAVLSSKAKAPRLSSCEKCHTCLRPSLKKGCVWTKRGREREITML